MAWLELKLQCRKDEAEELEALLWQVGAVSVTLCDAEDQPLFEPGVGETPLWDSIVLVGLFEGGSDAHDIQMQLLSARGEQPLPALHFEILPDQDWERAWLADFRPMRFGRRTWVCPSWWQAPGVAVPEDCWQPDPEAAAAWNAEHQDLLAAMQAPDQVVLRLDPGLAFGTGTHPTTALCLAWLDGEDLRGQHLVDFGCGSGILGIAALLLGAADVLGVDNDPQALQATHDNLSKNALPEARFPLFLPEAFARHQASESFRPADGVVANILAGTLIELAPQLAALVRPCGWLLLSGILRGQADDVQRAFTPWFSDFETTAQEDWVRITARRLATGDEQATASA
jgi:ribosomal protein L11 methyltransferase